MEMHAGLVGEKPTETKPENPKEIMGICTYIHITPGVAGSSPAAGLVSVAVRKLGESHPRPSTPSYTKRRSPS